MRRIWRFVLAALVLAAITISGIYIFLHQYSALNAKPSSTAGSSLSSAPPKEPVEILELSPEAQRNLGLVVKPLKLQTYWRTILIPGAVVDRPGKSDRGVSSPAVAVVAAIHAYAGDTVRPGDKLFSLRVFSEYLQNTQSDLFKSTRETQIISETVQRLKGLAETGAIPAARLIELENQLRRQSTAIQAYRQDLLTRGFSPEQVDAVTEGKFVSTIDVVAPPPVAQTAGASAKEPTPLQSGSSSGMPLAYEVQELKAELGQQVQAGQLLCVLSNHRDLYIEGHAFKQEAPSLERAAQERWSVNVEFAEDNETGWPDINQAFEIHHLANSVDPSTRTFNFFIPLINQSRGYEKDGRTFVVWRFRPGQRVRLHVPVDELKDVFVVPAAAVVREGPEAFMFRQNGNLFNRKRIRVLHEDRLNIVVTNDGQLTPGLYMAQNAAASLNRVLKAQAASGAPVGVHVHADGTVHGAH